MCVVFRVPTGIMRTDLAASVRVVDVIAILSKPFSLAGRFAWAIPRASHWIHRVAGKLDS